MVAYFTRLLFVILLIFLTNINTNAQNMKTAYDFEFQNIDGKDLSLSQFKNKVIVAINVASKCGFTNQYKDMQSIWEKYKDKNVIILGIPSNDFGRQEPGNNSDIKNFCESKFGVTFPMTEKVSVVGENAHPFYLWAKESFGKKSIPKWNFHKIIIGKDGQIKETFTSITNPSSKKFLKMIDELIL